jgi:hypothetical protein
MTGDAGPKAKKGFWPLVFCLSLSLPLLLGVAIGFLPGVPASAQSMSIFGFIAKVLFFCFLLGIPLVVVSALCSGLYLLFRFRRLRDDFKLYFALNCIFSIILIYAAAGILSGLAR